MPLGSRMRSMYRTLFRKVDLDADLDEELQSTLEMLEDERVRGGMSREAARRQARLELGGVEQVKEEVRQARHGALLRTFAQDVRYTIRTLRKRPGFALTAVLTLALGIGATTTMFSVVDAVVLRPLPFPESERLLRVYEVTPQGRRYTTSEPTFLDWRAGAISFTEVAACTGKNLDLTGVAEPVALRGQAVSHNLPPLLGIDVFLGRTFLPAEDRPGEASQVVILGADLWKRSFGGAREVLGRKVTLGGAPHTVIGVADLGKLGLIDGTWREFLVPLAADPSGSRGSHFVVGLASLAPGVSLEKANAEMSALASRIGADYPSSNEGWGAEVVPARDWLIGPEVSHSVYLVFAAVGFLLLLACANVSGLLAAHGTGRMSEIGMRVALGAGRARIIRQLVTESLVLALLGAAAGVILCAAAVPLVRTLGPADIPRLEEVRVSGAVMAFSLLASVLATLLAGLVPALQVSGKGVHETLRENAPTVIAGSRVRDLLVVGQLALAAVVLIVAGLMGRSFLRLLAADPGFDPEHVLAVRLRLPSSSTGDERQVFFAQICERLGTLPGVVATGATFTLPFGNSYTSNRVSSPDRVPSSPDDFVAIHFRLVTHGIFDAMGIPLLRGRFLDDRDGTDRREGEGLNVVVSKSLAAALWPRENPVGREVLWRSLDGPRFRVVGVVGDMKDAHIADEPPPMLYMPFGAWPRSEMTVMVRTAGVQAGLSELIRSEIGRLHPDLVIPFPEPLANSLVRAVAAPRFLTRLLGVFALLSLIIAGTGVYAVVAAQVAGRRREIGIRMALGADRPTVLSLVLGQGARRIAAGAACGLAAALAFSQLVASELYQTPATDPLSYAVVLATLVLVAMAATLVPAVRATRIDPKLALAAE